MPTSTLAERLLRVREAAGFGGDRQAAEFARRIGITPPSLHDLESGKSRALGKALPGLLKIGANLDYLEKGRGVPMLLRDVEKNIELMTLMTMLQEMSEDQRKVVFDVAKAVRRSSGVPGPDDPFLKDPPTE